MNYSKNKKYDYRLEAGDVIVRKKSGIGVIDHYGLYLGNGLVIDNHPSRGVSQITLSSFLNGRPIIRVNRFSGNYFQRQDVVRRAQALVGRGYDVTGFNCEHMVNEAWGNRPLSEQVNAAFGAFFIVAAGLIIGNLISDR